MHTQQAPQDGQGKRRQAISKLLSRLLGPAIFIFILWRFIDIPKMTNIIHQIDIPLFLLCFAVTPFIILTRSIRWKLILNKYKITCPLWGSYKMNFVGLATIIVIPAVGTFIRALYLKRDGYGIKNPVLSIAADKYFDYFLPLVFGATSILIITLKLPTNMAIIILLLAAATAYIPARSLVGLMSNRLIPARVREFLGGRSFDLKAEADQFIMSLTPATFILSIAGFGIYYLSILFLCRSLSINISFSEIVLVETVSTIAMLIPGTFFGIGTRDVGLIAAFKLFGHSPEEAMALSMSLLMLRIMMLLAGAFFWFADPPPLEELKKKG